MGKHFRIRHLDESHDKQPGCMWGLVHVLDYHHWQSNVRKMIQQRKYEDRTQDKLLTDDWSPESKMCSPDANDAEKLLVEKESQYLSTKRSRAKKKRSLKARIKALSGDDNSRQSEHRRGKAFKPRLQRTYSIHHLESLDDDHIGKIRTDRKHPIVFVPGKLESSATREDPDILEIFKVDKEFLISRLRDGDERVANFSRTTLGLNTKARFSKSTSFPVSEGRKLKPLKLENKQKEIWSFPRENKFETVNRAARLDRSGYVGTRSGELAYNTMERTGEMPDENNSGKHIYHRSSSLNESLEKYAQLFENSYRTNAKLNTSKSLKLTNAPVYFRRIRSLSDIDSCYSNQDFEVLGEKIASLLTSDKENVALDANMQIQEKDASLRLRARDDDCEKGDCFEEEAEKLMKSDSLWEKDSNCSDMGPNELSDHGFVLDLEASSLQETKCRVAEHQISEGLEHGSSIHESNFPSDPNNLASLRSKSLSTYNALNLENNEISARVTQRLTKNNSDLHYVRHLLDQSGISVDASGITWHASDHPFGPQLFDEVEVCWPHEHDQQNVWSVFSGCWHHQMLFDLVNEVLVEVYDLSLPYYPKALSSSCQVRPFPVGDHIIEDVCTSIGALLSLKPQEKWSLESIVGRDLAHDHRWMNLQMETESVALYLEEVIFNELLEEVVFS